MHHEQFGRARVPPQTYVVLEPANGNEFGPAGLHGKEKAALASKGAAGSLRKAAFYTREPRCPLRGEVVSCPNPTDGRLTATPAVRTNLGAANGAAGRPDGSPEIAPAPAAEEVAEPATGKRAPQRAEVGAGRTGVGHLATSQRANGAPGNDAGAAVAGLRTDQGTGDAAGQLALGTLFGRTANAHRRVP